MKDDLTDEQLDRSVRRLDIAHKLLRLAMAVAGLWLFVAGDAPMWAYGALLLWSASQDD